MWQPIKSAPKNGTELLLFSGESRDQVMIGHWSEAEDAAYSAADGWYTRDAGDYIDVKVTHWMPLPGPPATPL